MIDVKEEFQATKEEALNLINEVIEKISTRFTKTYHAVLENTHLEKNYILPVEFYEPKFKIPVSHQKVLLLFKVPKSLSNNEISFQIENESVNYPLYDSININYFENLLDRVLMNKQKMSQKLHLHSNFESTRILQLNGENLNLFRIDEEENILSNNNGEFFTADNQNYNFSLLDINDIEKNIKILWKTQVEEVSEKEFITLDQFRLIFNYGKLHFSEQNLLKLWKYCDVNKRNQIKFNEFSQFCMDLIQCLRAYHIAFYKHENNSYIKNKIKNSVEIMNLHFKEYDFEMNQEISYENLKKCLMRENELFSRKEIEIILQQINPEKNFEFWKFDRILKILYVNHFNYNQLMKDDKIYKYLIKIFDKQDILKKGKLHYRKMKSAFLYEDKLKLNKVQILVILNFFNINENPEIDYFKASLIIRDIIQELFSPDLLYQKIEMNQPHFQLYEKFDDVYDDHLKNIKIIFIRFDKDFDHLLSLDEFKEFVSWLLPYIDDSDKMEIFNLTSQRKLHVTFKDFKENFARIVNMTRIKNVFKEISMIIS